MFLENLIEVPFEVILLPRFDFIYTLSETEGKMESICQSNHFYTPTRWRLSLNRNAQFIAVIYWSYPRGPIRSHVRSLLLVKSENKGTCQIVALAPDEFLGRNLYVAHHSTTSDRTFQHAATFSWTATLRARKKNSTELEHGLSVSRTTTGSFVLLIVGRYREVVNSKTKALLYDFYLR